MLSTLLVILIIAAVVKAWSLSAIANKERTRKSRWLLKGKLVRILYQLTKDDTKESIPSGIAHFRLLRKLREPDICLYPTHTSTSPTVVCPRDYCPGCDCAVDLLNA